jgi:DNA-directed RNA polymerase subunit alpha
MFKPNFKTTTKEEKEDFGEFILSPLEPGYGHTLGNALRRILLTSLSGAAVTQMKIKGVRHQFTTLSGLKEDLVEFGLSVKQIRIKIKKGEGPFTIQLKTKNSGEIKAGDIKTSAELQIVNKDLVLGHLTDKKSLLQVEMEVERGFGYRLAERKSRKVGIIPLDATFSPVLKVSYEIKSTRVGRRTDLDKLILRIWTDGTIKPSQALEEAAKILVSQFRQIFEPVFEEKKEEKKEKVPFEVKRLSVEEILPTRIANALSKAGYKTVEDLSQATKEDIMKVKNFGEKSFKVLKKALKKKEVVIET